MENKCNIIRKCILTLGWAAFLGGLVGERYFLGRLMDVPQAEAVYENRGGLSYIHSSTDKVDSAQKQNAEQIRNNSRLAHYLSCGGILTILGTVGVSNLVNRINTKKE